MSAHPQGAPGGQYDDGYGHQGQDAYYQDDQYGGQYHDDQRGAYNDQPAHGDAYYDESCVLQLCLIVNILISPQSIL
jgi:1,3-beta-glucan synthase